MSVGEAVAVDRPAGVIAQGHVHHRVANIGRGRLVGIGGALESLAGLLEGREYRLLERGIGPSRLDLRREHPLPGDELQAFSGQAAEPDGILQQGIDVDEVHQLFAFVVVHRVGGGLPAAIGQLSGDLVAHQVGQGQTHVEPQSTVEMLDMDNPEIGIEPEVGLRRRHADDQEPENSKESQPRAQLPAGHRTKHVRNS